MTPARSVPTGGHPLQFGRAILYATVVLIAVIGVATGNRRATRAIRSDCAALPVQN
ncbi:hypothetical protein [Paracoccus sp. Ld10]|uniref:hypothetical protein n=1 Tax=Paracoccus sp. Ld10 TaxID=649158 RepID=UPI00386F4DE3